MRTTLNLDDDIFIIAKQKALRENLSIGQAVSELTRQGIQLAQRAPSQRPAIRSKYAVLPARDESITSEHVYKLLDQEGI